MKQEKLKDRIRSLAKLTPSETRMSEYFFHTYPRLMFENVASISKNTGVSKATVVRFIAKLGFRKFSDFQEYIRDETFPAEHDLPNRLVIQKKQLETSREDILARNFNCIIENLHHVHAGIDPARFSRAAELVMNREGGLYITGLRSSYALAYQFYLLMMRVRPNTRLLGPSLAMSPDVLLDVTAKDTLACVFRYPYARQTVRIARQFAAKNAAIVLITDREFSPLADCATTQLVIPSKGLAVFNSASAFMALLDSLQIAALKLCGPEVMERLKAAEELTDEMGIYCVEKRQDPQGSCLNRRKGLIKTGIINPGSQQKR